ncbi:hypothetical protein WR25_26777 [Diploscapter pachys]|uniref:Saposin A-type domain-containing protein n=1 Tax=Diploscapter pachys TaxID=2018661 RepID=A0A2A2KSV9_9BILA|nr:hypothetical protein WR25_26777 [Diploscapter pachys]
MNAALSKECGFDTLCQRYTNTTYDKRINITVFTEGYCRYCRHFFVDILYPKVYQKLKNIVNIEIVPYGNSKIVNGKIQCQHGEEECKVDKFESCVIDKLPSQDKFMPLLNCTLKLINPKIPFVSVYQRCFRKVSVPETARRRIMQVFSCYNSAEGYALQLKAARRTTAAWPERHWGVPHIIVNGISIHTQPFYMNIDAMICTWYNGKSKPKYCSEIL